MANRKILCLFLQNIYEKIVKNDIFLLTKPFIRDKIS